MKFRKIFGAGWFHYLFETIAITVGILGAFYLENWNQGRQEDKLRYDYLIRLKEDLQMDWKDLSNQMNLFEIRTRRLNALMPLFDQTNVNPDTFASRFYDIFYQDDFKQNDKTFNDMVNNGNLELFSRHELKQGLLELYALYEKLNAYEETIKTNNRNFIYEPATMKYDYYRLTGSEKPGESDEILRKMLSDVSIKNGCGLFLVDSPHINDLYQSALHKIGELDSLIALELGRY